MRMKNPLNGEGDQPRPTVISNLQKSTMITLRGLLAQSKFILLQILYFFTVIGVVASKK